MKLLKFLGKLLLALFLFSILLWTVVLGILQTESGQKWTIHYAITTLEELTQTQIELKSIQFSFPLKVNLEGLTVSEKNHPLFTLESAELECSYHKLVQGKLLLSHLKGSGLNIFSLPNRTTDAWKTSPEVSFIPLYIKVEEIDLQQIHLMPEIMEQLELPNPIRSILHESTIHIKGMVSHNPFRILNSILQGHLKCILHFKEDENILETDFKILPSLLIELNEFKLDTPNISLSGLFKIKPDSVIQNGIFKGTIKDLAHFKEWSDLSPQGEFSFEGNARGPISQPKIHLNVFSSLVSIQEHDFKHLQSTLNIDLENGFLGDIDLLVNYQDIPLQGSTVFNWGNYQVNFSHFQFNVPGADLFGELTYLSESTIWKGELEGHISDLSTISAFSKKPLHGELDFRVSILENQSRQAIELNAIANKIQIDNLKIDQLFFSLQGKPDQTLGTSFTLETQLNGSSIHHDSLFIESLFSKGTHHGDLDQKNIHQINFDWNAELIESKEPLQISVASSYGNVELIDPFDKINGSIQAAFQHINTRYGAIDWLEGATKSPLFPEEQWPFRLNGVGNGIKPFKFNMEGVIVRDSENWSIRADYLNGAVNSSSFSLMQPVFLSKQGGEIDINNLSLQFEESSFNGFLKLNDKLIHSELKIDQFPLDFLHSLNPFIPSLGQISFAGSVYGPLTDPIGDFKISLKEMTLLDELFASNPVVDGKINIHTDERGAQINSELFGVGRSPISIQGTFPLFLKFDPLLVKIDPLFPLDLSVDAEGELDSFLHFFSQVKTNLNGDAKIALRATGLVDSPSINGNIDLTNGSFESLNTGAIFPHIEARLEAEGTQLHLTRFIAEDTKKGTISATGNLFLDRSQEFPFEFHIQPSHLSVVDSDYATASVSGLVELKGNAKHSKLSGSLTTEETMIRLEETLPRQIKSVEVTYINDPKEKSSTDNLKQDPPSSIELDLNLELPGNVFIKGHHITSEWKGAIRITGTPSDPLLNGDLRIVDGEYDFNGKIFNLHQGNIHFAGSPAKKTTLYVVASKEIANLSPNYQSQNAYLDGRGSNPIDHLLAEIIVKGPIGQPVISFRSNPPLSQREVLSYILFNRGISDITTTQGDQLSQSFISFNSSDQTKQSTDFLSRLRNNIGIDRLDFATGTEENKDFSLQVGKYITDNLFVSINKSINAAANRIAVEANLGKNLKAQAEVGDDSQVRTSLKWKKYY